MTNTEQIRALIEASEEMIRACSPVHLSKQNKRLLKKACEAMTQAVDQDELLKEILND